jgi:hypothetical protein
VDVAFELALERQWSIFGKLYGKKKLYDEEIV